jgi:hypothetical protein
MTFVIDYHSSFFLSFFQQSNNNHNNNNNTPTSRAMVVYGHQSDDVYEPMETTLVTTGNNGMMRNVLAVLGHNVSTAHQR